MAAHEERLVASDTGRAAKNWHVEDVRWTPKAHTPRRVQPLLRSPTGASGSRDSTPPPDRGPLLSKSLRAFACVLAACNANDQLVLAAECRSVVQTLGGPDHCFDRGQRERRVRGHPAGEGLRRRQR